MPGRRGGDRHRPAGVENDRWHGPFGDAITRWFEGGDARIVLCLCRHRGVDLNGWDWGPMPWAFGELDVWFWNWPPLVDEFIDRVGRLLGRRIVRTYRKF